MRPPEARVVVVGAGASGLAVAGALKREGFDPLVLEKDERIGGTWARRYERLHLHTVRRFSGLPQVAIPKRYGRYIAKDDYARYLEDYAAALKLEVRLGERVRAIRPAWRVETDRRVEEAHAVVIATGKYRHKRLPSWPGIEAFGGPIVHSGDYRSGRDLIGRRVLVVGAGNSGTEIAADLAEHGAAHVAIAVRTTPPITPREVLGMPVQVWGIALSTLPARAVEPVAAQIRKFATRDLARHGLAEAAWSPILERKPPVIDVGFLRELRAGRIHVRPDVQAFEPGAVRFVDGTEERFDALIAATGFTTGLEELIDVPGALDERGEPRDPAPPDYPGLFFMGFVETVRGQLFEAGREAPRLARAVARHVESLAASGSA